MTDLFSYAPSAPCPADDRRLRNLRRRVARAKRFPDNTSSADRHVHLIAETLAAGHPYPMLAEEPQHCAESMLWTLLALYRARNRVQALEGPAVTQRRIRREVKRALGRVKALEAQNA